MIPVPTLKEIHCEWVGQLESLNIITVFDVSKSCHWALNFIFNSFSRLLSCSKPIYVREPNHRTKKQIREPKPNQKTKTQIREQTKNQIREPKPNQRNKTKRTVVLSNTSDVVYYYWDRYLLLWLLSHTILHHMTSIIWMGHHTYM